MTMGSYLAMRISFDLRQMNGFHPALVKTSRLLQTLTSVSELELAFLLASLLAVVSVTVSAMVLATKSEMVSEMVSVTVSAMALAKAKAWDLVRRQRFVRPSP